MYIATGTIIAIAIANQVVKFIPALLSKARQIVKPSATLLLINSIGDKYPKHLRGLLLIK